MALTRSSKAGNTSASPPSMKSSSIAITETRWVVFQLLGVNTTSCVRAKSPLLSGTIATLAESSRNGSDRSVKVISRPRTITL